jgi:hypothetical protein
MKQLGRTPKGGCIIELTESETMILDSAIEVLAGSAYLNPRQRMYFPDPNIAPLFEILGTWARLRVDVNHMRQILDEMQAAVDKGKS